ncbi:RidA family protein [Phenylobacterium sp.]|jgi:2-iminobutanoate/2-iminopropanoate deaminase|uniref:RidA family protein n=1 Tax=Phenylobacterium sp. TaxID=1871053 RepID=UPI002E332ECF|nr:RidA family protein [Phenylobacterium sp.]HEX3364083.1 RidA family protein [Phenylobacterium sp.]
MPLPHLAKWTEAQRLVFVPGQLPYDASRQVVGAEIGAQTAQALANLDAVLRDAGLDRSRVVKATVWLRAAGDFTGFDAAYAAFFGEHRPARSTVVCELVAPRALVEIEAVAARPA